MIRLKITPRFTDAPGVHLLLEWVEVMDEQITQVVATEEFVLSRNREGCSYITRGSFDLGEMMPGTFWIDEAGHRHFVMQAEPGHIGLVGNTTQQMRG